MDYVAKEIRSKIKQIHVGYKCLGTVSIGECMSVDDLAVFAKNISELQYNFMLWKEKLKKRNMNINIDKTKIMILVAEKSVEIEVESIKLEQVKSFKYLGVQIQNNGKQKAEINERINTAMKIYYTPNGNFLGMRAITKKTKVNVYKAIFCPILTYGCKS